jgi:hypothetical protein
MRIVDFPKFIIRTTRSVNISAYEMATWLLSVYNELPYRRLVALLNESYRVSTELQKNFKDLR